MADINNRGEREFVVPSFDANASHRESIKAGEARRYVAPPDVAEQLSRRIQAIAERWKGVNGGIYTIRAMALDMAHTLMEENALSFYAAPLQVQHASDCAVHREPAYPAGPCNCGIPSLREKIARALDPGLFQTADKDPDPQAVRDMYQHIFDEVYAKADRIVSAIATCSVSDEHLKGEDRNGLSGEAMPARSALAETPLPPPLRTDREIGELIEQLWQDLLDKDDRTSPEEYPDHALITFDEFRDYVNQSLLTLSQQVKSLTEERDDAAKNELKLFRRVQELEGQVAVLENEASLRRGWLYRAKNERGYSQNVSFDTVWAETCAKADSAEAAEAQCVSLRKALEDGKRSITDIVLKYTVHGGPWDLVKELHSALSTQAGEGE
jgi:hypothetical protein